MSPPGSSFHPQVTAAVADKRLERPAVDAGRVLSPRSALPAPDSPPARWSRPDFRDGDERVRPWRDVRIFGDEPRRRHLEPA